jgi:DNA-binding Lrp family transcriptional regulator
MGTGMSADQSKILAILQEGLPKSTTPFEDVARQVGTQTEEVLQVPKNWKAQGKLWRIGAIVNDLKAGAGAGATVVWQVEPERVEESGMMLPCFPEVSHAYERETCEAWPYNIYTTAHAANNDELGHTIERMSNTCGVANYRVLVTEKELKKAPPRYVT